MQTNKVNPIPNIITGLNLVAGCIAITYATFLDNVIYAVYFIFIAAAFDFLDGMAAKALKAESEFGKVFDSLVDIVSFGVAPAVILFRIMIMALTYNDSTFSTEKADFAEYLIMMSSFLITLFVGIRLARFTSSNKETTSFKGLPSPAAALLIASISYIPLDISTSAFQDFIFDKMRLISLIVIICILMVVNLPMMKMKFNGMGMKENFVKYLFLIGAVMLLLIFKIAGIPLIILLYIIMSIVHVLLKESA